MSPIGLRSLTDRTLTDRTIYLLLLPILRYRHQFEKTVPAEIGNLRPGVGCILRDLILVFCNNNNNNK
jgi:hypothetical protein